MATVQAFPAQSVTEMEAVELGCCAVICSMTICASRLAEVSLLFLLSEETATESKVVSAPRPIARISMANINSISVDAALDCAPDLNQTNGWRCT